jgi:hypothetical protein
MKYAQRWIETIDLRSSLGKEVRARLTEIQSDLGGAEHLSHAQRSLVHRAIWLELVLEQEEQRIAKGEGCDIGPHVQLVGALVGIYKTLGLKRQARDVTLKDVLKGKP